MPVVVKNNLDALTQLAISQAAATLAPALSQLATGQLHSAIIPSQAVATAAASPAVPSALQVQTAAIPLDASAPNPIAKKPNTASVAVQDSELSKQEKLKVYANELKKAYELHTGKKAPPLPDFEDEEEQEIDPLAPQDHSVVSTTDQTPSKRESPRSDEEKAAGTMLLGFLSSLRQSYMDAVREKNGQEKTEMPQVTIDKSGMDMSVPAVTDASSTQPVDSSMDDSDSDKHPSSSEESDKEVLDNTLSKRCVQDTVSNIAPRKRIKVAAKNRTSV